MRLWHQKLIPFLPRQQLLGQHRECCALRGGGWGKKHSTVDYVFTHGMERLVYYHWLVMDEMWKRGYRPDTYWESSVYRGKTEGWTGPVMDDDAIEYYWGLETVFPEHDSRYLRECLDNLDGKGIVIDMKGTEQ